MIRAIVFDCFGVLATGTWSAFLDTLPPDLDRKALHDLNRAHDAGILSHSEFDNQIVALTGSHPQRIESVGLTDVHKNVRLLNYIRHELRPQYKTGILSNISSDWITDTLLTPDEQTLFDAMIFSYQVGHAKPDPEIFQLTAERLDISAQDILFIDDIPANVSAAQDCGMQAVAYSDFHSLHQFISSRTSR
jgi:FMN phosphatase YigB (HAD superfamily)